jgi:protein SCO1
MALSMLFAGAGELSAKASDKRLLAFDADEALRLSRAAQDHPLEEYNLRDRKGHPLKLSALKGKPFVLSLIYTSCYHTCSVATISLAEAVEKGREALGEDSFKVVTVGFDTQTDNPTAMATFARQRGLDDDENWLFLSGDRKTINRLMKNIGFIANPSPRGFDHIVQATVVDGKGIIHRQVYGEEVNIPLLVEPLKDLVLGRPRSKETTVENIVRRVRFFCTTYDPALGGYRFDYSIFVGMFIGALIIFTASYQLFKEIRYAKKLGKY